MDAGFFKINPRISIHALREESDFLLFKISWQIADNFNPRSPRGERRKLYHLLTAIRHISIHALREESDIDIQEHCSVIIGISIHALREESDKRYNTNVSISYKFQSTLSARRATLFFSSRVHFI